MLHYFCCIPSIKISVKVHDDDHALPFGHHGHYSFHESNFNICFPGRDVHAFLFMVLILLFYFLTTWRCCNFRDFSNRAEGVAVLARPSE